MSSHGGEKGGLSTTSEYGDTASPSLADFLKHEPHDYDKDMNPVKRFIPSTATSKLAQDAKDELDERRRRAIGSPSRQPTSGVSDSMLNTGRPETEEERARRLRFNEMEIAYYKDPRHKIHNRTTCTEFAIAAAAF